MVVNHNGGTLLRRCVDDVLVMTWPGTLEVVVVDNASTDESLSTLASDSRLTIIELDRNTGFGANNEALSDLDKVDWVALVNPDAFVPPGFAMELTAAFDSPTVGAVAPKIVFDDLHHTVRLTNNPQQNVRLTALEVGGVDVFSRCHVVGDGAARIATSTGAEWHLGESCELLVPCLSQDASGAAPGGKESTNSATLFLKSPETTTVNVQEGIHPAIPASASPSTTATTVPLHDSPTQYIQNAGSWVNSNGVGGNRGFFEPDNGQLDEANDVFAWCGAAVMMRADYLTDVGLFDPSFFLYYEDTDLSWRGQLRGWTYWYEPSVVVRHRHSASTGQGSALTDIYQQRNRLRMLARNASAPVLARGVVHSVGTTAKIGLRRAAAVRSPGSKGDSTLFARRAKGILSAARDAPSLQRDRRDLSSRRKVPRAEVERNLRGDD